MAYSECPVEKYFREIDQFDPVLDSPPTLSATTEKTENEIQPSDQTEQPLHMQKSNQFINNTLDILHDEGGIISSEDEVPAKQNKLQRQLSPSNENAEKTEIKHLASNSSELPLHMQKSNQLSDQGLDILHGGGGIVSSEASDEAPSKKRRLSDDGPSGSTQQDQGNDNFFASPEEKSNEQDEGSSRNDLDDNISDDSMSAEPSSQYSSSRQIMEFDILDEFEIGNDADDLPDDDDDSESDISTDEIEAMLDAGLFSRKKISAGENLENEIEHEDKEKVILKARGQDHFDVLPEGWIEVTHNSGMPIYLHKQSRVCCVSKPYFLGPGSTRKHEIPISAIPCLHYLKELEKERELKLEKERELEKENENKSEDNEKISEAANKDENIFPSAKLESVQDSKKTRSLDFMAVRDYCKKRFEFQTITVKRFKTWSGRRRHQKMMKQKQRPSLPDSTKLITCPLPPAVTNTNAVGNCIKREFIMNPSGKSSVCILHEYVQHTLRLQPKYVFKELENASTPYGAVVVINDMEYGSGYGSSKKQAKSEAAKAALEILIPKMKTLTSEDQKGEEELTDVKFFDEVRVEDPRVCELSVKAGQPYPYQILLECLKRNYGMGDTAVDFNMRNLKHQKNEFQMSVGKHSVSVVCKNKRDGKHRASQSILQLLHPHINSWGSLLRMYGKGSCKTLKEKKEEEQRITELQSKACINKPNLSILNKLKEEMLKYSHVMKSQKPIGKLIPEKMDFLSTSDSNLKNVEL